MNAPSEAAAESTAATAEWNLGNPGERPTDRVDAIDGALGELSQFHETFGFYVHGMPIEAAILPEGWQTRAIEVRNENTRHFTGLCMNDRDQAK